MFKNSSPSAGLSIGLLLALISWTTPELAAQGSLTPPGPPGPTMKTLDQIDGRTPLPAIGFDPATDFPITIDQPGSYYLTQNLTVLHDAGGILLATGDVTIDLNGFALIGPGRLVSNVVSAITGSSDLLRITVRNGTVADWPGDGIRLGKNSMVSDCKVQNIGGNGITVDEASVVRNCLVSTDRDFGGGDGIVITNNCVVRDNLIDLCRVGIVVEVLIPPLVAGGNQIQGNKLSRNTDGVDIKSAGNIIFQNLASQNVETDFDKIVTGNAVGPILTGAGLSNTNASLANFVF
ncbi:right-handed parallel beta-helix repeat-containing protein [Candidatus Sumerlaeota bacterium]|nr:right-handed parallel beta-helix repeat-containing protein [Candidatus Sumerlaeota bacterium]